MRRWYRDNRVVALARCVHDVDTVDVGFLGTRTGLAFKYECDGRVQPPSVHRCAHPFRESSCRPWPIAPSTRWPRVDHVGDVNNQHPESLALTRHRLSTRRCQRPGALLVVDRNSVGSRWDYDPVVMEPTTFTIHPKTPAQRR